jgi:catechol 2,3-dioxygenase-like lactoylglutathione lyase family enzyme
MSEKPVAHLTHSATVLVVRNVVAAAEYYRDILGFRLGAYYGEPPGFVIIARDKMHVMLSQIADHAAIVPRWTISPGLFDMYFWVDDVEPLYAELVERGAKIDYVPFDKDYGCREFGVADLDGYHIAFGQVIK